MNCSQKKIARSSKEIAMPNMKKPTMIKPATKKAAAKPAPLGTPPAKPKGRMTPMPKTTKKAPGATKKPEKMTPQDAAMKKILEKKYGKIYG
jgi:hypothetical protein